MSNSTVIIVTARKLLNNYKLFRSNFIISRREYSVFPKYYIEPIFKKDEQKALFENQEAKKIAHEQIKPARTTDTSSEFHDPRVLKFINTIMRDGNKILATILVTKAFEDVKRIQLQRYHKATDEEKEYIELDPFKVFHKAVDNCTPILQLIPCTKGGITYQIPVPVTSVKAQHMSMKWLIEAAKEKEAEQRFYNTLAKELVIASQNEGRAIQWKQELHKKCQANRAYAHFRWL